MSTALEDTSELNTNEAAAASGNPVPPAAAAEQSVALAQNTAGEGLTTLLSADSGEAPESLIAFQRLEERRAKKRRKKIIRFALIGTLVVAAVVYLVVSNAMSQSQEEVFQPEIAEVVRSDYNTVISAQGALQPASSVIVTPEVSGIIENLSISEGQKVEKGQVLFTLKNDDLDLEVRDAEQGIYAAQDEINAADEAVTAAERARNKAWDEYNKAYEKYKQAYAEWLAAAGTEDQGPEPEAPVIDDDELIAAITAAQRARNGMSLEKAQSAYNKAVKNAENRTVKAPVSGEIIAVGAVNGAAVGGAEGGIASSSSDSSPLVRIADLTQMKVRVQINEIDVSTLAVDQSATVTFSAFSDVTLDAKVVSIASTSTGSGEGMDMGGGVVTFAVDLVIPKPDPRLKPGMTASVQIITENVPNALVVPISALTEEVDGSYSVNVVTNEETYESEPRTVKVGAKNGSEAVIEEGLEEGELIITSFGGAPSTTEDEAELEFEVAM